MDNANFREFGVEREDPWFCKELWMNAVMDACAFWEFGDLSTKLRLTVAGDRSKSLHWIVQTAGF